MFLAGKLQTSLASSGSIEPLEEIANRSDRIVVGRVCQITTAEVPSGGFQTQVTFTNVTAWKGLVSNHFDLFLPGGTLGQRRSVLVGTPPFRMGEDWVVFTLTNTLGHSILAHPLQGALRIADGSRVAVPENAVPAKASEAHVDSDPTFAIISTDTLRNRIQKASP